MEPSIHDIQLQILANVYKELEQIQKQIGELTVALRQNECITYEQAKKIINMMTQEDPEA